jgi:hypothetical protein
MPIATAWDAGICASSPWCKSRGHCLRLRAGLFVVETRPYLAAILLRLDASIPAQIRGASARGTLTTDCQGRFRSFPIQQDGHFLSVCRYVERNALRANLVAKAQDWRWNSLWARGDRSSSVAPMLTAWPVERPGRWTTLVNRAETEEELAALRRAIDRGRPYGDDRWSQRTARALGTESSLRPIGRPPKSGSPGKG